MKKEVLYKYLGTNGTIVTPVHLEDIYYVRMAKLTAGPHKILTNGTDVQAVVIVPEDEVENWIEIDSII